MGSAKGKRSWRRLDVVSRPREPAAQAKDEWVLPTRPWLAPRARGVLKPFLSLLPVYLVFPASKKVPDSLRIFSQSLYSFWGRLARLYPTLFSWIAPCPRCLSSHPSRSYPLSHVTVRDRPCLSLRGKG